MKYLNLASGASHFFSPAAATEATINALNQHKTFYGETEGLPALVQAIQNRYREDFEIEVPIKKLLVTAGTKQSLFNLFSILLQPGDEVILPKPSWFGFPEMFRLLQVKLVFLETTPEDNYAINPNALENLLTKRTRLFIFSNPANPTGRIYPATEISEWLKLLRNYPDIKVLSDEIYDLVVYDGLQMPTLLQFEDPHQQHLVVNGFSKNFGMSGWRIGYLIGPEAIIEKAIQYQHATISGVNPFIQEGAAAALKTRQEVLPARLKALEQNRETLINWLLGYNEIKWFRPQGAYYIFADFRELFKNERIRTLGLNSSADLCHYLQHELQVELVPGERFDCPGFARITFAVSPPDLAEALGRLDKLFR